MTLKENWKFGSTPFRRITYKERGRDKVLSPRTLDRFLQSYGSLDKEIIGIEEAENKSKEISFELNKVKESIDNLGDNTDLTPSDKKKMKELKVKQEKLNREKVKFDKILRPLKEQKELKEINERLQNLKEEDVAYRGLMNRKKILEAKPDIQDAGLDTTVENIRRT